jgi:hypothetical protein
VVNVACSPARSVPASATSSGCPKRPTGNGALNVSGKFVVLAEAIGPEATQLTVMLSAESSFAFARYSVIACVPAFAAPWATLPERAYSFRSIHGRGLPPFFASTEPIVTIRP